MDRALREYLESLAARAWLLLYCPRRRARGAFREFLLEKFPAAAKGLGFRFGLAVFFFLAGTALAWILTSTSPEWFYAFVDPSLVKGRDPWASREILEKFLYEGGGLNHALATFAGFLFTHNAQVGILAFSAGIAAGVPAAYLLFTNGLVMGSFLSVYSSKGLLLPFLGWILPHGIPEILAMLLCAAAGLEIGRALLFPGRRTRRDSLVSAGRRGAVVAAGSILLFAWAGLMEGIFRQVVTGDLFRFLAAGVNAGILALWAYNARGKAE